MAETLSVKEEESWGIPCSRMHKASKFTWVKKIPKT